MLDTNSLLSRMNRHPFTQEFRLKEIVHLHFSGCEEFPLDQMSLWNQLTDMQFISQLIPDVERVKSVSPTELTCRVRPKFSFLTGALDLIFVVTHADEPQLLNIQSTGKGIGAKIIVESELSLAELDAGTQLQWKASIVERQGLLKPVSMSLIQAAAQRVIADFWKAAHQAMGVSDG